MIRFWYELNILEKSGNMYIDGEMEIEDIIEKYPGLVKPLQQMGVQCMVCGEPVWGALKEKVTEKGLDLDKIVTRLNEIVESIENDGEGS